MRHVRCGGVPAARRSTLVTSEPSDKRQEPGPLVRASSDDPGFHGQPDELSHVDGLLPRYARHSLRHDRDRDRRRDSVRSQPGLVVSTTTSPKLLTILDPSEQDGAKVQRDLRASDAERQTVIRRLERALREGRLTIVEFDERTQAAYAARTRGELEDLTEDLPRDLW